MRHGACAKAIGATALQFSMLPMQQTWSPASRCSRMHSETIRFKLSSNAADLPVSAMSLVHSSQGCCTVYQFCLVQRFTAATIMNDQCCWQHWPRLGRGSANL